MKKLTVPTLAFALFLLVATAFASSALVNYPFFPADPPEADWVTFDLGTEIRTVS